MARTFISAFLVVGGGTLLYLAGWLAVDEIVPQVASTDWSLSGSSTILNRTWEGNQLYVLIFLYFAVGSMLVLVGLVSMCRTRRAATGRCPG